MTVKGTPPDFVTIAQNRGQKGTKSPDVEYMEHATGTAARSSLGSTARTVPCVCCAIRASRGPFASGNTCTLLWRVSSSGGNNRKKKKHELMVCFLIEKM